MHAAIYNLPDTVEILIVRGADANARDNRGKTALSPAILNGRPEAEAILRNACAKEIDNAVAGKVKE
jgi:ankyrin repeat protein